MTCSRCGAVLVPGARFCDVCGTQFAAPMMMGGAMGQPVAAGPFAGMPLPAPQTSAQLKPGGLSIAGMVTGIVSLVLFWTFWLAIPLAICGIVFGAIALGPANRGERGGRGFAITGIVTGTITIGILIIAFAIAASFVSSALDF